MLTTKQTKKTKNSIKIPNSITNAKNVGTIILAFFFSNQLFDKKLNFYKIRKKTGINKITFEKNLINAVNQFQEIPSMNILYIGSLKSFLYKNVSKNYTSIKHKEFHFLLDKKLKLTEIGVYFIIKTFKNSKTKNCFPSYNTIAKKANISRRHAIRIVKKLIEKNVIDKQNNNYVFFF